MTEAQPDPDARPRPVALITGASRGLGAALAEALAPGHHIVAVARTQGGLEDLDDRIRARGGTATLAPMDIRTEAAMAQLCRAIFDRWGGLDLWLHTAIHAAPLAPAAHLDGKDWERSIAINASAPARLIGMIAPLLKLRHGRAVFFEDARGGQPHFGAYGASKAAQLALARSWQAETARLGELSVRILAPRPMATALRGRFFPGENRATLAQAQDEARRLLLLLQ